jgi:hypothetical protein
VSSDRPNRPYATVAAFDTALRARLKSFANERRSVQDLRKAVAFDRLLARLQIAAPESWLLKGGVALEYRLERARATMDVDLTSRVDLNELHDALVAAATLSLTDYFSLRIGARSKPVADVESYRFDVDVLYENGALFEKLRVDVGFADPWIGEPQILAGQSLLEFAGIEPVVVRAIPLHQHLAEKIHAYTRTYGGRDSTRVKDLVDIGLLINAEQMAPDLLGSTLAVVFQSRGTHDLPPVLPIPPEQWRQTYPRLAEGLPIPQSCDEAHDVAASALARAFEVAIEKRQDEAEGHERRR